MDSGKKPPQFPGHNLFTAGDSRLPLANLSTLTHKMDSLHRFLSQSITHNTLLDNNQMHFVSSQITSALHQIILNGTALLASPNLTPQITSYLKPPVFEEDPTVRTDLDSFMTCLEEEEETKTDHVVEIDAVELLAEHVHFCEICGKGFKRDANLRMHMRAHGNQFKTPEALAKPDCNLEFSSRKTRFSCPYVGCNRNKSHTKFQALKSVICVKNHFKRSHCPKMYSCNRCNKKSFSVVSDLKSHVKHCGESKWRCSCGTTFSRKDKLFGHMALFEGHMPEEVDDERAKGVMDFYQNEEKRLLDAQFESFDSGFFDGLGGIDNDYFKDVFGSPTLETRIWELYDFP